MSYRRTDYVTSEGKKSAAYYEPLTMDAWDVFTRAPVELTRDTLTGEMRETIFSPPVPTAKTPTPPKNRPQQVILKPFISPWQIIPIIFFALGMWWLEATYGR